MKRPTSHPRREDPSPARIAADELRRRITRADAAAHPWVWLMLLCAVILWLVLPKRSPTVLRAGSSGFYPFIGIVIICSVMGARAWRLAAREAGLACHACRKFLASWAPGGGRVAQTVLDSGACPACGTAVLRNAVPSVAATIADRPRAAPEVRTPSSSVTDAEHADAPPVGLSWWGGGILTTVGLALASIPHSPGESFGRSLLILGGWYLAIAGGFLLLGAAGGDRTWARRQRERGLLMLTFLISRRLR